MNKQTREQYLNAAVKILRPWFKKAGHLIPDNVKVTCGWPSTGALARKKRSVGECWPTTSSKAKANEIFISPSYSKWVAGRGEKCVGEILVHELAHAVDDCEHGHKGQFIKIIKGIGLEGKPTDTVPGEELWRELKHIQIKLGKYPHSELDMEKAEKKSQTTRLIKCECPDCGYNCRVTRKWLEEVGAPLCPCTKKAMAFEIPDELNQED